MEERFGFIHDKLEIKMLILFILRRLPEPVTFETLSELTLCDEGISYFDFVECVSELVATEHIKTDGHTYDLTEKGVRNSDITESSIPYSVRLKAEKNTSDLSFLLNRKSMISTSHTIRRKGGYTVELSLSDGISEIITLKLYAVSQAQAQALENGFTKNAEAIYNKVIQFILEE
ncbi:MAG: DUF4364 family protein [Clostridiales bacterium]|nr:DUF4364 family protein [Clostridiales bacterium]